MASHIGRRKFLATLGSATAAWPLASRAQQAKLPTIGFFSVGSAGALSHWVAAFVQRLRELGWIEGRTVVIEYRWAEGRNERLAEIATEFVQLNFCLETDEGSYDRSHVISRSHAIEARCGPRCHPQGREHGLSVLIPVVHFGCWHEAAVPASPTNVRSWG